jgi:L-lactate dehydrogenase complex protein LldG
MDQDPVSQFKHKYETLAGIVHIAEDEAAAAGVVLRILKEVQGRRVALGALPETLLKAIDSACSAAGIAVLKPPFDNRELPHAIDAAQVGVSWAALAVAETGSLVEFATDDALRLISALPRIHVGIFRARDLLATHKEAADPIREFFIENNQNATATFISGPSRTGDIEMRLTLGVHGPEIAHAVVLGQDSGNRI